MAALRVFVAVAAMAILIELATAKNITVGAPNGGWDLKTNLSTWASSQSFAVGDSLNFTYDATLHDVLEVTKANYGSCQTSGPIKTNTGGSNLIPLTAVGSRYFICGTPGHCAGGMKVQIDTVAATTPPGSSSPPPSNTPSPPTVTPPPSGSTSPPPSNSTSPPTATPPPPPPPGSSGANDHGLQAKAAIGFGLGMLMLLAL